MLEDDFSDVIKKSINAQAWSIDALASQSRASVTIINQLTKSVWPESSESDVAAVCACLEIDFIKLKNQKNFRPVAKLPAEITMITTPFGYLGVNCFHIQHGNHSILFDTGTDASAVKHLNLTETWITHPHYDHTQELSSLNSRITRMPESLEHAIPIKLGDLTITPFCVDGHCYPSKAYFIEGLATPVCILGDCLFAGSMGNTSNKQHYTEAKENIIQHIFTLPEETVLCPGHGPLTTVAQEMANNPFFI